MSATALRPKVGMIFRLPEGKRPEQMYRVTKIELAAAADDGKVMFRPVDENGRVEAYGRGRHYRWTRKRWNEQSHRFEQVGQGSLKAAQSAGPKMSDAGFRVLFARAHEAGMAAGEGARPTPMVVQQHEHPLDDSSPVVDEWFVGEGLCGFAWVVVRPGNGHFGRWLRRTGKGRTGYRGGVHIWVGQFNQSIARKEAYAQAFAEILREAGIQAFADSRLD